MNNIGITPSTIYPDFTGLAEEIKTPHKFIEEEQVLNLDNELIPTESFLNNALKIINTTKL